jgi:hypothetical protein
MTYHQVTPATYTIDIERCPLHEAAPKLLEALKLVWEMFDDGRIVRNIKNDGKPDWALRMLTFTKELQVIEAAIAQAEFR